MPDEGLSLKDSIPNSFSKVMVLLPEDDKQLLLVTSIRKWVHLPHLSGLDLLVSPRNSEGPIIPGVKCLYTLCCFLDPSAEYNT